MHGTVKTIPVIQGQFKVSNDPAIELSTVLGSCVAACMHDPVGKIGGMNHFLLPGSDPRIGGDAKYGAHSMEVLINALLQAGAMRRRLQVWLFGGGNVVEGLGGIGAKNAAFARQFIADEGFLLMAEDLGGKHGRRVRFSPASGRIQGSTFQIDQAGAAPPPVKAPARRPGSGTVELF